MTARRYTNVLKYVDRKDSPGPCTLPPFGQETYALQHTVLGTFPLFLVPVGGAVATSQVYPAVINNART